MPRCFWLRGDSSSFDFLVLRKFGALLRCIFKDLQPNYIRRPIVRVEPPIANPGTANVGLVFDVLNCRDALKRAPTLNALGG
jgi:hypothetical protein